MHHRLLNHMISLPLVLQFWLSNKYSITISGVSAKIQKLGAQNWQLYKNSQWPAKSISDTLNSIEA